MIRHLSAALVTLLLVAPAAAQDREVLASSISIGGTQASPSGSSVRLKELGTSGGTYVLLGDATDGGNIRSRLLGVSDIPSAFTRDDVAEAITQPWTFGAGLAGALPVAGAISSTAATGLPASIDGRIYHTGGYSSPVSARSYLGDGTGWHWALASRVSSTDTDRFRLSDRGRFEFAEHLYPFSGYTSDLAQPSAKMRSLHAGELFIDTLVAQERITTMGGRFTVTPSNVLTRDINASVTTICVKYNSFLLHVDGVEYGSKIVLEKAGQYEAMLITSLSTPSVDGTYGDYCYTVLRNQDGSGANAWVAGDGIIDTGKTGSGMIDQFAVRGLTSSSIEGPSIDFLLRTGVTWDALAHRASIGNLNGRYGYSGDTWGLAAGDPAATYITAEATNGFRIIGPSNTVKFHAKPNGDIDLSGSLAVGSSGHIRGGATAYSTGTGFWLGDDGGTSKLYIGNGTSPGTHQFLRWTGSGMELAGSLTAYGGLYVATNSGAGYTIRHEGPTMRIGNSSVTGVVSFIAPLGFTQSTAAGGNTTGFTGTKTVRASGGASDCTLVFNGGWLTTGGTC